MMKEVKVGFGVVGLGVGMGHCQSICDIEGSRLIAVADLSKERCTEAAQKYSVDSYQNYHELLNRDDVEVVMVCTPSGLHAEIAVDAAKAGKHVLVEKPIEITIEKSDRIIEACDKAGVKLGVNFHNRFAQDNIRAKKAIDKGKLGRLVLGDATLKEFRTQEYYDRGGWRGTWKMDVGGAIMNQSIHEIDILQWFMGDVETIFANAKAIAHKIETEDIATAVLTFKNGALGVIVGTTAMHRKFGSRIEIHGDKGAIITERNKIVTWELAEGGEELDSGGIPGNSIEDMIRAVRDDREPFVSGKDARKTLQIILALYESAKTGKVVRL